MKAIPSIHTPIQESNGSIAWVWYLFFQWLAENAGKVDLSDYFTKEETEALLELKANTADLATVAFTGDYDDLTNKPTIPTVGNGTITITQGGETKGSFTTNQDDNTTINLDAGGSGNYHPDLFDVKWADHICNDVQWLRADTFSWQSGAVYQVAYQHLADDITGKTLQSETISGTTIQFYLADDGHKICPASEESNVAAIYNATGVAWYYIIDTTNQRFKLPRTKFGFTGIRNGVGKFVDAGLPNITGWGQLNDDIAFQNAGGALYLSNSYSRDVASNRSGSQNHNINLDASRSSSIYGNSNTVQPKATEMYLYFYVGNFTQTALENTAGVVTEDFNELNAHKVIDFQAPTSSNNYTWYRKYADGWVEQGGRSSAVNGIGATTSITLLVAMSDTNYSAYVSISRNSSGDYRDQFLATYNRTTTGFGIYSNWAGSDHATVDNYGQWFVCGIAA